MTKIEQVRRVKRMTQKALSETSGISIRTIQYWEKSERSPTLKMLRRVADALEVSVRELI